MVLEFHKKDYDNALKIYQYKMYRRLENIDKMSKGVIRSIKSYITVHSNILNVEKSNNQKPKKTKVFYLLKYEIKV